MLPNGHILIVNYEPMLAELLITILTDEGYLVTAAEDVAGALAAIGRQPPELVLLDLGYPSWRGSELARQVRAAAQAAVPIVLMTTEPHGTAHPLMHGMAECIAKPFDLYDLLDCVARYVRPAQAAWQPAGV